MNKNPASLFQAWAPQVCVAAVYAAFASPAVQASAVMTFDPIASTTFGTLFVYTEAGFRITALNSVAHASWGSSHGNYTGSQALFNNSQSGVTVLSKVGGGSFSFDEIELSELYNQGSYPATSVTFIGALTGGGTTSFSVNLDLIFGNQHVDFGNVFRNVTSVSWTQTALFHQFDNLVMDSGNSVPEPTSLALVALAMIGLGVRRPRRC